MTVQLNLKNEEFQNVVETLQSAIIDSALNAAGQPESLFKARACGRLVRTLGIISPETGLKMLEEVIKVNGKNRALRGEANEILDDWKQSSMISALPNFSSIGERLVAINSKNFCHSAG